VLGRDVAAVNHKAWSAAKKSIHLEPLSVTRGRSLRPPKPLMRCCTEVAAVADVNAGFDLLGAIDWKSRTLKKADNDLIKCLPSDFAIAPASSISGFRT
jgi:hypothetical protein